MAPRTSAEQREAWADMAEFVAFSAYVPARLEILWSEGQDPSGGSDRRLCDYWIRWRGVGQGPAAPQHLTEEGRRALEEERRDLYQYALARVTERGESLEKTENEERFLLHVRDAARVLGSLVRDNGEFGVARQCLRDQYRKKNRLLGPRSNSAPGVTPVVTDASELD